MQESEVRFEVVEVGCWGRGCGPEDWVVVGEEGEDEAEEEGCCYSIIISWLVIDWDGWG